jgi:hypothetical protein
VFTVLVEDEDVAGGLVDGDALGTKELASAFSTSAGDFCGTVARFPEAVWV